MNFTRTLKKYLGISILGLLATSLVLGAPRRQALVIGNDSYAGSNPLKNARNDAQAMADKLAALGYLTSLQLDADQKKRAIPLKILQTDCKPVIRRSSFTPVMACR